MPMMAFIGVRISWLMLARKSLLARLAWSAASRASRSSSWYFFSSVMSREIPKVPITSPSSSTKRHFRRQAPGVFAIGPRFLLDSVDQWSRVSMTSISSPRAPCRMFFGEDVGVGLADRRGGTWTSRTCPPSPR